MTDSDGLPPVQVTRGGISYPTHWDMLDAELQRLPWGPLVTDGALVAAGGFCAPLASLYDIVDRTPWTHADLPLFWDVDVDAWLFPRLTSARRALTEGRRRLRCAYRALRGRDFVEAELGDFE